MDSNRRALRRRSRRIRRSAVASAIALAALTALIVTGCSGLDVGAASGVPPFTVTPVPTAVPTANATPTAPASSDDGTASTDGEAVPAAGSFDEFDGPAGSAPNPAHWVAQTGAGGWGNNELQTYTAENGVLDGDGHLVITADIGAGGGAPWTSARLTTHGLASFGYGTVSARMKLPDGESLLPSFWMLGSNIDTVGWPVCGEIDVVEAPISTTRTSHFLHGPGVGAPTKNVQAGGVLNHAEPMSDGFHTYSVTRTPGHVVIRVDGVVGTDISRTTAPVDLQWVFDGDFDLVLSMAIGGSVPAPTATTPRTAQMVVDWVRFAAA